MVRLTKSNASQLGGRTATATSYKLFAMAHVQHTPTAENGAEVDRTARGTGSGRGWVRRNVLGHVRQDLPPPISVSGVPRPDVDDRACLADPHAARRHPVHRVGGVHPQHPSA